MLRRGSVQSSEGFETRTTADASSEWRVGRWCVAILGLIAAYSLLWPVWRAVYPMEIASNEGWNAYHQDAALHGILYPPADALVVNNYPPLSFYLIGWLARWLGEALYVGRAISLLSVFGLAVAVGLAVRRLGGGTIAAVVAGVWFLATMAGPFNRFVAMNDPQLLGQFVMAVALLWFLARDAKGRSAVPPILLMVVAGFIKHNIIAIPVTTLLWLALRDGRRAIVPVAVGALAAAAGLLLCIAVYGDAFLANLFTDRLYALKRVIASTGRLQWVLPALVIWAIWAWQARHTMAARFTALFVAIGLVSYFAQWAGESVLDNAQFDLLIAFAIGIGLAFEHAGAVAWPGSPTVAAARIGIVAVLAIRLLATGRIEPALILFDPAYRAEFTANAQVVASETARIAAIEGDVWCRVKVICRRAGKPFVVDEFKINQMRFLGKLDQETLDKMLAQRGIRFDFIDLRTESRVLERNVFDRFRPPG